MGEVKEDTFVRKVAEELNDELLNFVWWVEVFCKHIREANPEDLATCHKAVDSVFSIRWRADKMLRDVEEFVKQRGLWAEYEAARLKHTRMILDAIEEDQKFLAGIEDEEDDGSPPDDPGLHWGEIVRLLQEQEDMKRDKH